MTNQQPKPLRLADQLDTEWSGVLLPTRQSAAAELRRLYAENEALKAQRQPLTDDHILGLWQRTRLPDAHRIERFAHAIEATHGITGETK